MHAVMSLPKHLFDKTYSSWPVYTGDTLSTPKQRVSLHVSCFAQMPGHPVLSQQEIQMDTGHVSSVVKGALQTPRRLHLWMTVSLIDS